MQLRLCNAEVFERLFAVLYVSESFVHCIFQVSRGANKCASDKWLVRTCHKVAQYPTKHAELHGAVSQPQSVKD
jgi:hypothetical protein